MYRIAIVDDEPVIRFGIRASVDWAQENIGLAGDFANGEDAWQVIREEPVDILITDIKMPVMDGLELTKRTLALYPKTKVILVSSYNDFEYVRQGLKLGVVDYLLKPTLEPEGLLELVRRCLRLIEEERRHDHDRHLILMSKQTYDRKRLETDIRRALISDGEHLWQQPVPTWLFSGYALCTVLVNRLRETEEQYGSLHVGMLLEEMQEIFYDTIEEGIAFLSGDRAIVLWLPVIQSSPLEAIFTKLRDIWSTNLSISVTVGYAMGIDVEELRLVYRESVRSAKRRFFEGEGEYGASEMAVSPPEQPRRSNSQAALLMQELRASSHARDPEATDAVVCSWMNQWSVQRTDPDMIRREAFEILTTLFMNEQDMTVLLEGFEELKRSETLEELTKLLQVQIRGYRNAFAAGSHTFKGNKQLIDKAIAFISTHYTGELTLQQLADHVHMSKNYFCLQFKHHTGHNFIDYIIRLRIGKAKELIAEPGLKIYEVAEKAGFNDVKYFSKLFKKTMGLSPIDYRERLIGNE
jgi:two-component system response regulator YesN